MESLLDQVFEALLRSMQTEVIFLSVFEDLQTVIRKQNNDDKLREKENRVDFPLFRVYIFPKTNSACVICGTRLPNNFPVTVASKLRSL